MAGVQMGASEIELLHRAYAAFNRREIETVIALMHANVDWPNGMEGGRVLGTAAVRDYWKRQFEMIDSHVEPKAFTTEKDGRIAVDVHQVAHNKAGNLLADRMVQHVLEFGAGLFKSMAVRD